MLTTSDHMKIRSKRAHIAAYFFLMIGVFLSTGFLPQCLDYFDGDNIEFSENAEEEAEEEKKENKKETENDKYNSELAQYALFNSGGLNDPDGHFHKWQNPSADIITPPPDFI